MKGIQRLYQFIAVAEELHFGRAAERLHMTQPPLSMQIRRLEEDIGTTLLRRTKRSVELTEAGAVLLSEARRALAQLERAIALAQRAGRGETGNLRIGFISTADYSMLPPLAREFRRRYPDVDLTLGEMTTDAQLKAFAESDLDIGFIVPPGDDAIVDHMTVMTEFLVVALPDSHELARAEGPLPARALADEDFIMFPRSAAPADYDKILGYTEAAGFTPRIAQIAVQMQTIVSLVSAELGVALVPACLRNLNRSGVVYRDLEPAPPVFETAIAWPKRGPSEAAARFIEIAAAQGRTGVAAGKGIPRASMTRRRRSG